MFLRFFECIYNTNFLIEVLLILTLILTLPPSSLFPFLFFSPLPYVNHLSLPPSSLFFFYIKEKGERREGEGRTREGKGKKERVKEEGFI